MDKKINIIESDKLPPGTVALVSPGKADIQFSTERTDDATIITATLVWVKQPSVAIVTNVQPPADDDGE